MEGMESQASAAWGGGVLLRRAVSHCIIRVGGSSVEGGQEGKEFLCVIMSPRSAVSRALYNLQSMLLI